MIEMHTHDGGTTWHIHQSADKAHIHLEADGFGGFILPYDRIAQAANIAAQDDGSMEPRRWREQAGWTFSAPAMASVSQDPARSAEQIAKQDPDELP